MSDFSNMKDGKPAPKHLSEALAESRASYRERVVPSGLEAATLAQMRAARERAHVANTLAVSTVAQAAHAAGVASESRVKAWLKSIFANRWSSALAGSLATIVLATVTSPIWLSYARESVEVATPFMLVNQPDATAQLDVAQMLRVNVTREAMLDFGIPVPPQRLQEEVKAEMLIGHRGELLAVRFVEREREKRWRWQLY
jgi:hypothetical protein